MNSIVLVGRLSTNVDLKKGNDKTYAKFNLAVNRAGKRDEADFISCTAFGKLAETMFEWCKKGHRIGIQGRLQISNYEKDGEKRTGYTVIVENMEFLQTKNEKSGESTVAVPAKETAEGNPNNDFVDDEFPF